MSFSGKVKEEIAEHISSSRHCQIAELSALLAFGGKITSEGITFSCENEMAVRKYFTLLRKTFNIDSELSQGDTIRVAKAVSGPQITQKSCCRRAYLRGAFLVAGSVNDPDNSYHFEIACLDESQANYIVELLASFEIDARTTMRKKYVVVYIKEGSQIVEALNVVGAHVALMDYENSRILKDMRNSINRRVNCETANINKTVVASVKQKNDIDLVMKSGRYKELPEGLKQMAEIRVNYPNASLKELGELMSPPIGKSGVNHRLRKLSEIADSLRVEGGIL